ncbi:MAG: hypothetical protein JEZ05_00820 [Tenericutes bacterium]|nr:hypothetical protein [Mycoplasmatota bacterium]
MKELYISDECFTFNNEKFTISDFYTSEYFTYCNQNSQRFKTDIIVGNEVFNLLTQNYLAIEHFIIKKKIKRVYIQNTTIYYYSIIHDISEKLGILLSVEKKNNFKLKSAPRYIVSKMYIFISFIYLIFRMIILIPYKKKKVNYNSPFSIIRTPAAKSKMSFLEHVDVYYEDWTSVNNIYSTIKRVVRLKLLIKCVFQCSNNLKAYKMFVSETHGPKCSLLLNKHYSKRILHTLIYNQISKISFDLYRGEDFYTGNCLDRFSFIESINAKKNMCKIICIPHGMEYGYKFPKGYACDLHYCTTEYSCNELNKLYGTKKFIYDSYTAEKMLRKSNILFYNKTDWKPKIVFFTEPRDVYVNLEIIQYLLDLDIFKKNQLYIKLHPKDREIHYSKFKNRLNFLDSFEEAIGNNICLSRKSTILVEALYNNSKSIAIIINQKDKATLATFPSLQDGRIFKIFSIQNLRKKLDEIIKQGEC